jgi:VIT1/CCC1 family predicted Fe2+/Mn2+ transporter
MHHYTHKELANHLRQEHNISAFSTYLQEIVYGGNDGIVTTFAVVAGFAGANISAANGMGYMTVLLFGLANLFADGASMGLGNLLSLRSEQDRYRKEREKEELEIERSKHMEMGETRELLMAKGFDGRDADTLVELYSKNKEYWADFMMRYELEMSDPTSENPWLTGLATFISFMTFGFIPLIPYIVFGYSPDTFLYACLATFVALFLLGVLRYLITKQSLIRSIGEILLIGGLSASVAFFVGTFFKQ